MILELLLQLQSFNLFRAVEVFLILMSNRGVLITGHRETTVQSFNRKPDLHRHDRIHRNDRPYHGRVMYFNSFPASYQAEPVSETAGGRRKLLIS